MEDPQVITPGKLRLSDDGKIVINRKRLQGEFAASASPVGSEVVAKGGLKPGFLTGLTGSCKWNLLGATEAQGTAASLTRGVGAVPGFPACLAHLQAQAITALISQDRFPRSTARRRNDTLG